MYYSGGAYQTRRGWRCGYAESHDGINWHRRPIVLNGVEQPGNQSPYLYPFRDVEQRDPSRRYVSFFTEKEGGHVDGLAYSPDCLHWTLEPEPASTVNSTLHVTEIPVISYRDPNGVYFCIGRSFYYSGRSLGIQYSDDLITWGGAQSYPERPDGDPGDSTHCATYGRLLLESSGNLPHEHQIYYGYGTKERDNRYWLYYAPCRADCRYELALAAGRNGTDFDRVVPGEYLLPCGPLGAWDNGFIAGFKPVIVGDTLRFYYGSSGWHHNTDKHGAYPLHRPNWRIGMAEGARGKQVCVQCSRVSEPGRLRTKEIQLGPDQTILGAVFDGPSDAVRVTAFGPAGRPAVSASGSQLPVRLPRAARIWVDVEIRDPAARFFGLSLGHRGAEVVR